MEQKDFVLLGIIVFLVVTLLFFAEENARATRIANQVISSWSANQDYLISVCKIDYNEYMREQTLKQIRDLNLLVNPLPFNPQNSPIS